MRSNYKRLGAYIKEVNIRNSSLEVELLLGVSIKKIFMPSIANIVGTDMSTYKIVRSKQFAYGPVTSRNGDKISIALLEDYEIAIISQAYTVFEVIDHNELDPEYLMMWFRRPEFDRYARFKSHGSAREIFGWEEMLEVELPIPSIDKQREIVKEYNTVVNRIKLNEQLNQKLEETAQALYKHWFVDFEFPISKEYAKSVGKPGLEGKPYKSSGGKMEWCEELDKEVPRGWEVIFLNDIADITAGGDKPNSYSEYETDQLNIPIYANSTVEEGLYGYTSEPKIFKKSITVSARGAIIGYTVLRLSPFYPIVRLIVVSPKDEGQLGYLFESIKKFRFNNEASAQGQLTVPDISGFRVLRPIKEPLSEYQIISNLIITSISNNKKGIKKLLEFKDILLSKMTKLELVEEELTPTQ